MSKKNGKDNTGSGEGNALPGITVQTVDGRPVSVARTTLPCGLDVTFAVPGRLGWDAIWREIREISEKPAATAKKQTAEEQQAENDRTLACLRETLITFSVSPKFVDKAPRECGDGEHSVWILADDDIGVFMAAIRGTIGFGGKLALQASAVASDPEFRGDTRLPRKAVRKGEPA